jgi:hypothetical protein
VQNLSAVLAPGGRLVLGLNEHPGDRLHPSIAEAGVFIVPQADARAA